MNPSVRSNATTGFTLAEVLVGLVILAVGILAIAGMQIIAIKGSSFSRYLTRASVLAQESLESLKGLEISSERLNTGNYLDPDYKDPDIGIFKRSYRAIRNPDYVDLQYTVEWKENEHTHRVSFTTIKAR
jgi:prepilin-type N-terminal cleavage/methylation domain-containing protein